MEIRDVTYDVEESPIRLRGELTMSAEDAFTQLRPTFERVGFTPKLRKEDGIAAVYALPVVFGKEDHGFPTMPVLLFVATLLSVFFVGLSQSEFIFEAPLALIMARLSGNASNLVYPELIPTDPQFLSALGIGLAYAASLVGILGAHEMGHYLVARRYKVDTTPPFFIPLPIGILGTLGAVIAMREPAPNRKVQFDIGIAGPLAGLVVCVPILFVGLLLSDVTTTQAMIESVPPQVQDNIVIFSEGNSIAYLLAKLAVFGQILPQGSLDVEVHPVAFAGWAGLLVTALNLLPVGQLDGGHVVYGLFGDKAQKARTPIIIALAVMAAIGSVQGAATGWVAANPEATGQLATTAEWLATAPLPGWSGWWIWVAMLVFLVRNHAPVLDEITGLDQKRRRLGVVMIIIFVLIFTPRPLLVNPMTALMLGGYTALRAVRRY
jgi:membrane-associated protease RseP (regulator of RpoE activity)